MAGAEFELLGIGVVGEPMVTFLFWNLNQKALEGRLAKLVEKYEKAIELNPQSADAYANRGIVRLSQIKDAEAQADFDQCLKLNPAIKESLNRRIEYVKYHRKQKKR